MTVRELRMMISSDVTELATARGFVDRAVTLLGFEVPRADLAVATSELVANAVALDAGDVTITVTPGRRHAVRLAVTDCGPGEPEIVDRDAWDPDGHRGLQIIDQIAVDWGVDRQWHQKTVWCELPGEPAGRTDESLATT